MDIRKVKKLIELINETAVTEIEIKEGEESLRISRGSAQIAPNSPQIVAQQSSNYMAHATAKNSTDSTVNTVSDNALHEHIVKSPMVGTLYISHTPEADPFVSIGDHVNKGDIICIIEAMKMFNQIEADATGIIKARLVENGDAVEYDQPLFIIEAD